MKKIIFALLFLLVVLPIFAVLLFGVIYLFIAQPFQIVGVAMAPNYVNGQYFIANKLAYKTTEPARSDVIIFKAPKNPEKDYIKRIIGLPRETISISKGDVYVNGNKLDESAYIKAGVKTYAQSFLHEGQSVTVPEKQYFVLGDNRPFSSDSRDFGFVPEENIIGTMYFCYLNCELSKK